MKETKPLIHNKFFNQSIRTLVSIFIKTFYRLEVHHRERIPLQGGILLVANHVSYVDALIIQHIFPRPIRFMSFSGFFQTPILGSILKSFHCIPVSPSGAKEAMREVVKSVANGEVVCIFPEGELTTSGELHDFKKGIEIMIRKIEGRAKVLPLYLDDLWGSIFSYYGGYAFWKLPQSLPRRISVIFGLANSRATLTAQDLKQEIIQLRKETKTYRQRNKSPQMISISTSSTTSAIRSDTSII
ncbi:MAG: 1-acyl-sn-glycerol-3-phosphate acyltransferase [Verrucomicrobiota bacterium]